MNIKLSKLIGIAGIAMLIGCGCSRNNGWSISGVIENAPDSVLYIEEPSGPVWVLIDSLKTGKDGSFAYTAEEPYLYGQGIMRIRMGNKAVYFPIEGTETLRLTANASDIDKIHSLSGSVAAEGFNMIDSLVNAAISRVGVDKALNDSTLLTQIGNVILADTTCIVGYYAIKHPVENKLLFGNDTPLKTGLIGAAATRYETLRPSDARGSELKAMFQQARKNKRGNASSGATMEASVSGRPVLDFVRKDEKGADRDLNAVLDRGGVTVVNFTRYDGPQSTANTTALGDVYNKYKDRGLEIYQISFDPVEANWRQNAHNMPWISVYNRPTDPAEILVAYNVNPVDGAPTSFIFNRQGELIGRTADPAKLEEEVAKAF